MKENKNEVMVFNNEMFGSVRVVNIDGEAWLVGKDVVEALGYNCDNVSYSKYIKRYCYEEDYNLMKTSEMDIFKMVDVGRKGEYLINESGLYQLIANSKTITKKQKEDSINFFKKFGMLNDVTLHSRKEIEFIDKLERALLAFNVTGKKQHNILNYKIDYYIPSLNVAIEYDENGHKDYTYEAHELRQELIQKELGCRFIRVTDNKDDYVNIGLVIKELFNIK